MECPKCKKETLKFVEGIRWWVCPNLKCSFGVPEEDLKDI